MELSEWPQGQMVFIGGIWWLMHSNNLQFSAAVLLSGNNFAKIELMSSFLGLSCPSRAPFCNCKSYVFQQFMNGGSG